MKGKGSNKQSFAEIYTNACYRYGVCPQKSIANSVVDGILNIRADRIRTEDWQPILESIEKYEEIKYLAVRNKSECDLKSSTDLNNKLKREISNKFCQVVKNLLLHSKTFECLILEKLSLSEGNVTILNEGLSANSSLRFLSFEKCRLGDKFCQVICQSIKNSSSLSAINFSDCNLTWKIAHVIKNLIEQQTLVRHGNIWQNSLRYQICHLEKMGGLSAINLSFNPAFGDKGVGILEKGLTEETCLKELYLQHCGLTDESAAILIKLLSNSKFLNCINVDDNSLQDERLYEKIYERCENKPNMEKWERKFMPQLIGQSLEKIKPIPFKTGLPNRKMGIETRSTVSSVKIRTTTRLVSEEFDESNRKLKEQLHACMQELEEEKSEHLKTKQNFHKIMTEMEDKDKLKSQEVLDDSVLTAIEGTFKKFQDFINLLKTSELENFVKVPPLPTEFLNMNFNKSNRREWISLPKRVSGENVNKYNFQTYFILLF